jgi:predicted adenine nucleotide alpha hydrolase (AANH) superfamily ATPase
MVMKKPRMLVHICCAPDALYVVKLLQNDFLVSGYFYNPNIHPRSEYDLRRDETKKVADILGFDLLEGPYDQDRWHKLTHRFKDEPEKGRRCDICYASRLQKTASEATAQGFDVFTTVMSLSPWKKADALNKMGMMFANRYDLRYLQANFKRKAGFQKSILLSREHDLYRQNYCGCVYSEQEMLASEKRKKIDPKEHDIK